MELLNTLRDHAQDSRHEILIQENQRLNYALRDKISEIETLRIHL